MKATETRKLRYSGHIMRDNCLEKHIIQGTFIGNQEEMKTKNNTVEHCRLDEYAATENNEYAATENNGSDKALSQASQSSIYLSLIHI